MEDLRHIASRAIASYGTIKAFLVLEDAAIVSGGFSFPLITIGAVERRGMLRIIHNPLAFTPGSGVFQESTCFMPDTSVAKNSLMAISFSPIPSYFSLFFSKNENVDYTFGAHLLIPVIKNLFCESLILTSRIEKEYHDDQWFFDKPLFPGENIYNFSSRVVIDTGGFFLSFLAAFSAGDLVVPGYFFSVATTMKTDMFILSLLASIKEKDYLTPEGQRINDFLSMGAACSFGPVSWFTVKSRIQKMLAEGSSVCNLFSSGKDYFGATVNFHGRLARSIYATTEIEYELENKVVVNLNTHRDTYSGSGELNFYDIYRIKAVFSLNNNNGTTYKTLSLANDITGGISHLLLSAKYHFCNDIDKLDFSLKMELKNDVVCFYCELKSKKSIELKEDWLPHLLDDLITYVYFKFGFACSL